MIGVYNRRINYFPSVENRAPWSLRIELTGWQLASACIALLALINFIPSVHREIWRIDTYTALLMNSLLGIAPDVDKLIAWLNTKAGDLVVLSSVVMMFVLHSFAGSNSREVIRRLSFWGWVAALCIVGYGIESIFGIYIKRQIPLIVLHQLTNVQTIYGVTLRTSPFESFPSGHATGYIFFALMAWSRFRRMSLSVLILGIVLLSTRLIVGVHWLSDMLLGALPFSILIATLTSETFFKVPYVFLKRMLLVMFLTATHRLPILAHAKT